MKRPLFFVALAYALGEVIGICTKTMEQISIALVVLISAGIYFVIYKKRKSTWIIIFCIAFGMISAFFRVPDRLKRQSASPVFEKEGYQVLTYQKENENRDMCTVAGMIVGMEGSSYILRILESDGGQIHRCCVLIRGISESEFRISDIVRVTGGYIRFRQEANPGAFPSALYYYARGIEGYFYQPDIRVIELSAGENRGLRSIRFLYRGKQRLYCLRNQLDVRLQEMLPGDTAALFSGILLGNKTEISQETKKLYQIGGLAHVLAISGLHISLIGGGVFKLLRKMRVPYLAAGGLSIIVVFLYGVFTGMSLATMRAVLMLGISMIAQISGRSYDMPTSMGVALLCMLLINPARILDSGMQLSYMAIAGVSLGNYIIRRLHKNKRFRQFEKKHKIRFFIAQSLLYSASLNAMMIPVLAKSYYVIPTYAWIVNLLAIPLMTVVVVSGWIGILCSFFSINMGIWAITPADFVLRGYDVLCKATLKIPGNAICTGEIGLIQMLAWYGGILVLLCMLRREVRTYIRDGIYKHTGRFWRHKQMVWYSIWTIVMCVSVECIVQHVIWNTQRVEQVCFLDVGQGDGILIRSPRGNCMVIDGGSTSQTEVGTYAMLPALKSQGMFCVDYWFVTHTDEDHISGLKEILAQGKLSQVQIKTIVFSAYVARDDAFDELESLIKDAGVSVYWMDKGDCIGDGSFTLTCLHPGKSYRPADKNAASLALAYHSNQMDMLFTGDMDADAVESMMMGSEKKRGYDCVKLPHHGSKYSYNEKLYADTEFGVISCGWKNRYGHPHEEVLDGLEAAGVRILRTDMMGAVIFRGR